MSQDTLDVTPSEAKPLSPDERFRFSCTQCGECCFDQLVLLDPFDLFYLSRLGGSSTTKKLFEQNVVELVECDGEWRCALVMPKFQRGTKCRFLSPTLNERGKILGWSCELHSTGAKPLVCTSSPVARDIEGNFYLVAPVSSCPGMNRGEPQTLRDYLSVLQIEQRQAWAEWFHKEVRPAIKERAQAERLYNFDAVQEIESAEALKVWIIGCRDR